MVIKLWNELSLKELAKIPPLYSTNNIPLKDKLIYEHFFIFSNDHTQMEVCPSLIVYSYSLFKSISALKPHA